MPSKIEPCPMIANGLSCLAVDMGPPLLERESPNMSRISVPRTRARSCSAATHGGEQRPRHLRPADARVSSPGRRHPASKLEPQDLVGGDLVEDDADGACIPRATVGEAELLDPFLDRLEPAEEDRGENRQRADHRSL